jgi:hypothetical protein
MAKNKLGMLKKKMRRILVALMAMLAGLCGLAPASRADVLFDQTSLVAASGVAPPSEHTFTVATAQALTVTLTDFQTPAAFTSLQIAVTLGDTLVGMGGTDATTGTATVAVPGTAGIYTLHVIGSPAATQGFGSFGVCVAPAASAAQCIDSYSYSGNIETPATASSSGTSALNTNFTATVAGDYTVTLTDDVFPRTLQSLSAGVFQGSTPINVAIPSGSPTQVTLAAGTTYQLLVAAVADATLNAGLYGIQIADPTGALVFNRTLPVGTMPASTQITSASAAALSLTLTDFDYPAALAQEGVAVTSGSTLLSQLTAPGSVPNFMAPAGVLEIWQYTAAGAQPGVYSATLANGTSNLFSATNVVDPAAPSTQQSYAFAVNLPTAGSYNLVANDFQFPVTLQTISATVAQNGTGLSVDSSGNFTASAGYVVVVVQVTPSLSGASIFGVTVQTGGASPQIIFQQTQEVNAVTSTQTVNATTTGDYDFTLTDLDFPSTFANLSAVVSQGTQVLGKIYAGGGSAGPAKLNLTPGQYVLTLVATPNTTSGAASTQNYGLYTFHVASSVPSISLTSSASTVTSGQTVQLTWTSQDATSCTAGGGAAGWSGDEPVNGTATVTISASSALVLTCTGAGGSASQSVTITAGTSNVKLGGGGGLDAASIAALALYLMMRSAGRRRLRR